MINLSKPKLIVSSKYAAANIANIAAQTSFIENLIVFDLNAMPAKLQSKGHTNILDYNELINRKNVNDPHRNT